MLTFFSVPKPFRGHIEIIQRNAIGSWARLEPRPEILLFGAEEGTAEAAAELGATHCPRVARSEFGTPLVNDIFDRAQSQARHDLLCYVNCDIILLSDFIVALERVARWRSDFLMIGRRWDLDIREQLNFDGPAWEENLRAMALRQGKQRPPDAIDYFGFPRGLCSRKVPRLSIGRMSWDNWLVWKARKIGCPVVDASRVVLAIHQNHDYAHIPGIERGIWQNEEVKRNYKAAGGWRHFYSIENASHRLTEEGVARNWRAWVARGRRDILGIWGMLRAAPRLVARLRERVL